MEETAVELIERLSRDEGPMAELRQRAARRGVVAVLPEGDDDRVVAAAIALRELGLARPLLLGSAFPVRKRLTEMQTDAGSFEVIDPAEDARADRVAERLFERRRNKGLTQGEAHVLSRDRLHLGAGLVALDVAQVMVAGAAHATGDVIRAALYHVGLAEGISVVSGAFLMLPPAGHALERPLLFADAAVVPEPTEEQLVAIGVSAARSFEALVGRKPKVACLSFSTKGSAQHPAAERMARVAASLRERGLDADGELQLDAALVERVGRSKAPGSPVAGQADVLLFPDLQSGNIGYKLAQRLGGFDAVGPVVQGLARPVFDLSRGCSADDVVNTVALAALLSGPKGEDGR